jgi:hypothetical protein
VSRKVNGTEDGKQFQKHPFLACQLCGRMVKATECSWQEDDDGLLCCQDCRAEMENCGCSD